VTPTLTPVRRAGIRVLTDPGAAALGVLVAWSDRIGGVSAPPFDTLNLAATLGDDPAAVARNRALVADAVGFEPRALALSRQVHGAHVAEVGADDGGVVGEADGLVTRGPGPVLGILSADCAAVAIAGERGVALVHAGWRGLAAGVVERGVASVAPARAAWVGPCIRSCCYEVGPDVVAAFAARGLPVGRGRVDVSEAACRALARAGVAAVAATPECTGCSPRYFSHRREGRTGRQGAFACLLEGPAGGGTSERSEHRR
jgi:YfiH family protein